MADGLVIPQGESAVVDPDLVRHVAWALCNLRVLAHFVACMPDRFFDEASVKPDDITASARDGVLKRFEEIATLSGKSANAIASSAADTARLFVLLDELAQIAYPATADTMRITASYQGLVDTQASDQPEEIPVGIAAGVTAYLRRNATLTAGKLDEWIRRTRKVAMAIFAMSILLSVVVVFGKQFLQERDAIYRKIDEVSRTLYREDALRLRAADLAMAGFELPLALAPQATDKEAQEWVADTCPSLTMTRFPPATGGRPETVNLYRSLRHMEVCQQLDDLNAQRRQAEAGLKAWAAPFVVPVALIAKGFQGLWRWIAGVDQDELDATATARTDASPTTAGPSVSRIDLSFKPWGETVLASLSTYILPVMLGVIGAWAAAERALRRRIDRYELARTDGSRFAGGVIMGGVLGGIVGLVVVGTSIEQASLSISAIALLAGFGSDRTFRFLDGLVDRIFGEHPPTPGEPPRK
jgi:hypothetical protein